MPQKPARIIPYFPEQRQAVRRILLTNGWEERYIIGQLEGVESLAADVHGGVWLAQMEDTLAGFVSLQFYAWNRLAQIHGLAVDPAFQRQGLAAALVQQAEDFARQRGARGVYVDTPVTNTGARSFYTSQGYIQDYVMTAYYDDGLDGVTYLKLFGAAPHTLPNYSNTQS